MKMAIIIQCHKNEEQINRLIEFFNDKDFDIYIHIDKKSDIVDKINKRENVIILENRIDVRWGRFSQVEATLELLKEVKRSNKQYNYIHLLSGQDYPIKDLNYIKEFFINNNVEYIDYIELPNPNLVKNGEDRYKVYYPEFIIERPRYIIRRILRVIYREIVLKIPFLQRNIKSISKFYYGSQWFSITSECMTYILDYIYNNENTYNFFKNSIYSDEMFFQTILLNSKFRNRINNNNLRYLDWSEGKESPKTLNLVDIKKALDSNKIFARKIDDIEVIKFIDKALIK